MNKKNDSFPQKLPPQPQTHSSGESLVVSEEKNLTESAQFTLFNKTTLIGVGILAIALASVAVPYSLGWLSSPTAVAELESESGDPEEELPEEPDLSLPLASPPSNQYATNDDFTETSGFYFDSEPDSSGISGSVSVDPLASLSEWNDVMGTVEEIEEVEEEDLLSVYEFETISDEPVLPEKPAAQFSTQSQKVESTVSLASVDVLDDDLGDGLDNNDFSSFDTPHSPTPPIQARIDRSAINSRPLPETAASPGTPVRVTNHDSRPATTHPLDENDRQFLRSRQSDTLDTNPVVHTNYTAQSLTESSEFAPVNAELLQNTARSAGLKREYRPKYAQVRQGSRTLPNTHGQLWCEYDITPFTKAPGVVPGSLPEQTLVKWILRQTGEESWYSEPFGILSATTETLYVYHTPEMQEVVAEITDRFVNPKGEADIYLFRVVSLNSPNWLTQFHADLKPIRIDTPGAQGWLIAKENHARMIPELARRSDYKELCSPQFPIRNGRQYVISSSIPKDYTPNVLPKDDVWPGYVPETAVINEGYSMSLIPLSAVDGVSADLMVKCNSIQIEKMHSVALNVPNRVTSRQRIAVESPQVSHFQLDEQIRWPKDRVLVLSLGTIPVPSAAQSNDAGKLIPELSRKISGSPAARGHVLLFVECRTQ